MKRKTPWTAKRLNAALNAVNAMLSGEEGEGDAAGTSFADLNAARDRLEDELNAVEGQKPCKSRPT